LHEEVSDLTVVEVKYNEQNSPDSKGEGFVVKFSDNQECFFSETMLQAELRNEETFLQVLEWGLPEAFLWDASLLAPPVFEHSDLIPVDDEEEDTDAKRKFLSNLISTGIALVSNVPP
jgi:hypothetical protein